MVDGWGEDARYVLSSLARIEKAQEQRFEDFYNKLNSISVEVAVLKTKAAFTGAIAGTVVSVMTAVVVALLKVGVK